MSTTRNLLILLFSIVLLISLAAAQVELKKINVLTLYKDRQTNARRGSSIPQLKCSGGNARSYKQLHPTVVQCYNKGTDDKGGTLVDHLVFVISFLIFCLTN